MLAIGDIPIASQLQLQLDQINMAIAALDQEGTTVTNVIVTPGAGGGTEGIPLAMAMPIHLVLDPPMTKPSVLSELKEMLKKQAGDITQQLVSMGFADDTGNRKVVTQTMVPPPVPPVPR